VKGGTKKPHHNYNIVFGLKDSQIAQKANKNEVSLDFKEFSEIKWSDNKFPNIVIHAI